MIMELAALMWKLSTHFCVEHAKRKNNTWADELTKRHTETWNPERRYSPALDGSFFYCLDKLTREMHADKSQEFTRR